MDPNLSGAIDRISLRRAIGALPAGCRKIFGLHEVHGYQHHEIAELLDCSAGNSKSQLHKAKRKMRSLLLAKWSSAHLLRAQRTTTGEAVDECYGDVSPVDQQVVWCLCPWGTE
jgi:hypothetical protein